MKNLIQNAVHVLAIGSLSIATLSFAACDSDSTSDGVAATPSIYDVAQDAGFTTLVAAVNAADLQPVLSDGGPFTVFAPTNAAFEALPDGTVENLLKPENKATLTNILTYHVVEGRVTASQVVNLTSAKTVQGQDLTISVQDGNVYVNGAMVTAVDVEAENGIIHVIDAVLLPASE